MPQPYAALPTHRPTQADSLVPQGENQFTQTIDEVNRFMSLHKLPSEMRVRVREFFHAQRSVTMTIRHNELIGSLSPELKLRVGSTVYSRYIKWLGLFRHCEPAFVVELYLKMHPRQVAPRELIAPGVFCLLTGGQVIIDGTIFSRGKYWGEDIILQNEDLVRKDQHIMAMTFVTIAIINRHRLMECASDFPNAMAQLRWQAVKLALHRTVVKMAEEKQSFHFAQSRTIASLRKVSANGCATGSVTPPNWPSGRESDGSLSATSDSILDVVPTGNDASIGSQAAAARLIAAGSKATADVAWAARANSALRYQQKRIAELEGELQVSTRVNEALVGHQRPEQPGGGVQDGEGSKDGEGIKDGERSVAPRLHLQSPSSSSKNLKLPSSSPSSSRAAAFDLARLPYVNVMADGQGNVTQAEFAALSTKVDLILKVLNKGQNTKHVKCSGPTWDAVV